MQNKDEFLFQQMHGRSAKIEFSSVTINHISQFTFQNISRSRIFRHYPLYFIHTNPFYNISQIDNTAF